MASERGLGTLAVWFWRAAGLESVQVEAQIRQRMSETPGEVSLGEVVRIKRLDSAALLRETSGSVGAPETGELDSIPFPSLFIPAPESVICVQGADRVSGSLFRNGDSCWSGALNFHCPICWAP